MDKTLILNKIKKYLNLKTDIEFAKYLGVSHSVLATWKKRNSFNLELIVAKCPNIDANWLITGEGPMLKNQDDLSFETEPFEYKKTDEFYSALKQVIEDKQKIINMLEEEVARLKQEKLK